MRSLTIFAAILLLQAPVIARTEDRTAPAIDRLSRAYKLDALDDIAVRTALRDAARTREDVRRGLLFNQAASDISQAILKSHEPTVLDAIASSADTDLHDRLRDLAGCYRSDTLPAVNYAQLALFTTHQGLWDLRSKTDQEAYYRLERTYEVYRQLNRTPLDAYAMAIEDLGEARSGIGVLKTYLLGIGRLVLTGYSASDAARNARAYMEAHYAYNNREAKDIAGVRRVETPFGFMSWRIAEGVLQDNRTMIAPVKAIIDQIIHGGRGRAAAGSEVSSGPDARGRSERAAVLNDNHPPLEEPPPFEQIGLPLWLADTPGWQRSEWTQWAATNIPFMSGHETQGPWWKLRQPDGAKKSWLNKYTYVKEGSRIVFYVWWWGTADTSAFFAVGNLQKTVPLEGRFTIGASTGKVIRVELTAPKPNEYGRIWIHFSASGKFALTIGKIYDR
jgi:hypothetical protein